MAGTGELGPLPSHPHSCPRDFAGVPASTASWPVGCTSTLGGVGTTPGQHKAAEKAVLC